MIKQLRSWGASIINTILNMILGEAIIRQGEFKSGRQLDHLW